MGNTQICKECDTFEQKPDKQSLPPPSRSPVNINVVNSKEPTKLPGPKVISLADNKFRIEYGTGEVYEGEAK